MENKYIINSTKTDSIYQLRDILSGELYKIVKNNQTIIFLCIGTDRSTGDSLGPIIGEKLKSFLYDDFKLYGTLENPVHAKNLCSVINNINKKYKNPYIIAIDACLGKAENIGNIIIEDKALSPGAAMKKTLPKVGNLSITGIVNISGALDFMVLQNTRLYTVMHLANIISHGIYHAMLKTIGHRKTSNLDFLLNSKLQNKKIKL